MVSRRCWLLCALLTPLKAFAAMASYPIRGNWWSSPARNVSEMIGHLQAGEHAGKFELRWLQELGNASRGWEMLNSLHSDDHEGKAYVVVTSKFELADVKKQVIYVKQQNCGPCKTIEKDFDWLREAGWEITYDDDAMVRIVDITGDMTAARSLRVMATPTLIMLVKQREVKRLVGYHGKLAIPTMYNEVKIEQSMTAERTNSPW